MTVNSSQRPNHIAINGDLLFGWHFGEVCSVIPISIPGAGHTPHVRIGFVGGLSADLSVATAIELARRLPEAIAGLPAVPDCSGAVWDWGKDG